MALSERASIALASIAQAAVTGKRCPVTEREGVAGLPSGTTAELARAGYIRIEVYPHNWRVIEILQGPYKGRRTKAPPKTSWRPYLVVDSSGPRRVIDRDKGKPRQQHHVARAASS
jgi:hypothetical protein